MKYIVATPYIGPEVAFGDDLQDAFWAARNDRDLTLD